MNIYNGLARLTVEAATGQWV